MSELSYGRMRDLGGLPELLRAMAGDEGVADAFNGQDLPLTLLDSPDALVPMRDLIALYQRASEITAIRSFGLEASSNASVEDRGIFGAYIAQAPTLAGALRRAQKALPHFESGSELSVEFAGDKLVLGYRNHLQGLNGWRHAGAFRFCLGIRLSKDYLGDDWHPDLVETCFPKGHWEPDYEDFFGAPVLFEKDRMALVLPRELADTPRPPNISPVPPVAFAQIVQMGKPVPKDFVGIVANIIDRRMRGGQTDIEGTARALGLGPRTVQRRLSEYGLTYRELLLRCRMRRARGLLAELDLSIGQISRECCYTSTPQFTRAFKSFVGAPPVEIRKNMH